MKIAKNSVTPFDYEGLQITDYTSKCSASSSFAEIIVNPGIRHPKAYSKKSDKYYYIISGNVEFVVEDKLFELTTGDVCIIFKREKFFYQNKSEEDLRLILVHTPAFDPDAEIIDE